MDNSSNSKVSPEDLIRELKSARKGVDEGRTQTTRINYPIFKFYLSF